MIFLIVTESLRPLGEVECDAQLLARAARNA
jgi:hypothetical protein